MRLCLVWSSFTFRLFSSSFRSLAQTILNSVWYMELKWLLVPLLLMLWLIANSYLSSSQDNLEIGEQGIWLLFETIWWSYGQCGYELGWYRFVVILLTLASLPYVHFLTHTWVKVIIYIRVIREGLITLLSFISKCHSSSWKGRLSPQLKHLSYNRILVWPTEHLCREAKVVSVNSLLVKSLTYNTHNIH